MRTWSKCSCGYIIQVIDSVICECPHCKTFYSGWADADVMIEPTTREEIQKHNSNVKGEAMSECILAEISGYIAGSKIEHKNWVTRRVVFPVGTSSGEIFRFAAEYGLTEIEVVLHPCHSKV